MAERSRVAALLTALLGERELPRYATEYGRRGKTGAGRKKRRKARAARKQRRESRRRNR